MQSGRYKMLTEMKAIDALRLLINPGESRVRAQFRIREGQRLRPRSNELVKGTKITKTSLQAALKSRRLLACRPGPRTSRRASFSRTPTS